MRVKADRPDKPDRHVVGYYGERRIRNGDVFYLKSPSHFSKTWMKPVKETEGVESSIPEDDWDDPNPFVPPKPKAEEPVAEKPKKKAPRAQDKEVL